uniref:Integrator complex subunit 9 n=1 Tax=Myotis myotis TaxID=51298 RepID=A0A7J7XGM1_MYOMY|nr:integrator complex subunit 9 [Myotis myotis]
MEMKPGVSLATVSAVLHTKDNKHALQPPPRPIQPTGGKKRKRVTDDIPDCKVLKPLLSGSIPVEQFVQTLEKVSTRSHICTAQEPSSLSVPPAFHLVWSPLSPVPVASAWSKVMPGTAWGRVRGARSGPSFHPVPGSEMTASSGATP